MAGGTAWLFYCAWRYGGEDPWRLYNQVDAEYRPVQDPSKPAIRPRYPRRYLTFQLACAKVAAILDGQAKNTRGVARPRPSRR